MKRVPTLNFVWPSLTTSLILILLAISCSGKPENQTAKSNSGSSGLHPLPLRQDSGFVTKKDGLPFLIANNLTDTVGSYWANLQEGDTLGKYYKVKETGHFYYCSIDYSPEYIFETHLIIELNQVGKVLQSARFFMVIITVVGTTVTRDSIATAIFLASKPVQRVPVFVELICTCLKS